MIIINYFINIIMAINLFFGLNLYASQTSLIKWEKTIDSSGHLDTTLHSIIETKDGGYVVIATTYKKNRDILVIKFDNNGNKLWEKTFGGKKDDKANSIIETNDEKIIIVGWTDSFKSYRQPWIIELNKNGDKIWDKTLEGPEMANFIIKAKNNTFIVTEQYKLIKFNENGKKIWDKAFNNLSTIKFITQINDGNYIIVGNYDKEVGDGKYMMKIDENGNQIWKKPKLIDYNTGITSISKTKNGGFIVVGYDGLYSWIKKFDNDGNEVWNKKFDFKKHSINCAIQSIDNKTIIAGKKNDYAWIMKLNDDIIGDGDIIWEKTLKNFNEIFSIVQNKDKSFIAINFQKIIHFSIYEEKNKKILSEASARIKGLYEKYKPNKKNDFVLEDVFGNKIHIDNKSNGLLFHEFKNKIVLLVFTSFHNKYVPLYKIYRENLINIQNKYRDIVRIVSIDAQNNDKSAILKTVIKEGVNYPAILYSKSFLQYIAYRTNYKSGFPIPLTLAFDRNSDIQFIKTGVLSEETLEKFIKQYSQAKNNFKDTKEDLLNLLDPILKEHNLYTQEYIDASKKFIDKLIKLKGKKAEKVLKLLIAKKSALVIKMIEGAKGDK